MEEEAAAKQKAEDDEAAAAKQKADEEEAAAKKEEVAKDDAPKEEAKLVRDALNANKTGLILSERLVNVPQDVGGPLVKQLFDEIKWAVKDEKKKEFDFDQYILVSRCFAQS